jgi:hypothetical protein
MAKDAPRPPRTKKLPGPPRRGKGDPIPWLEIEDLYVQSDCTLADLSRLYLLPSRLLGHKSSHGHWRMKRIAWQSKISEEVSKRVFEAKAAIAVDVRLRGILDRMEHIEQLTAIRKSGKTTQIVKLRGEDGDKAIEVERKWSSSDHLNFRKTYDEAESGILRALGIQDSDMETIKRVVFAYLPENAREGAEPEGGDDGSTD